MCSNDLNNIHIGRLVCKKNDLGNFNLEVGPVFLFVIIKNVVVVLVTSCSLTCLYFTT